MSNGKPDYKKSPNWIIKNVNGQPVKGKPSFYCIRPEIADRAEKLEAVYETIKEFLIANDNSIPITPFLKIREKLDNAIEEVGDEA